MSNFDTLSPMTEGLPGTAAQIFSATTDDSLGTITASGYVADLIMNDILKPFDIIFINYSVSGSEAQGLFTVTSTGGGSLVSYLTSQTGTNILANSQAWAGGSASHAFTITGLTTSSIVVPIIQAQTTGTVYIEHYTITANTLTVTFSADPGAMVLQYIAFIAPQ